MCYGPEAALFCDLFDASVRYTGISFVHQFLGIFASRITPIIATYLIAANGDQPWYLCAYVVFAALVSAACAGQSRGRSQPALQPRHLGPPPRAEIAFQSRPKAVFLGRLRFVPQFVHLGEGRVPRRLPTLR